MLENAYGTSPQSPDLASVLNHTADLRHGEEIFETCAACHGSDGAGQRDGTVPAIAAQQVRVIAGELLNFRHAERRDERMEHFTDEHHLSGAQDIADIAAYVSHLRPTRSLGHGNGQYTELGAGIYRRQCASCHGVTADGDDHHSYPRLAGQHYEYLLHQLQGAEFNRQPNFAADHIHLLHALKDTELVGISDYLSRLGP
jgi:cytochrome c553